MGIKKSCWYSRFSFTIYRYLSFTVFHKLKGRIKFLLRLQVGAKKKKKKHYTQQQLLTIQNVCIFIVIFSQNNSLAGNSGHWRPEFTKLSKYEARVTKPCPIIMNSIKWLLTVKGLWNVIFARSLSPPLTNANRLRQGGLRSRTHSEITRDPCTRPVKSETLKTGPGTSSFENPA